MNDRCSYDTCPKTSIVRGLCEQHFLIQFVQPLQKERRNSEDVLALLNANIAALVQELYKAKHPNDWQTDRFLRRGPNGYTNTATVFCHKCWKGFDSGIECLQHEEDCKVRNERAKHRASGPSIPKQHEVLVDEGDIDSNV
jgi:hypothetical protein